MHILCYQYYRLDIHIGLGKGHANAAKQSSFLEEISGYIDYGHRLKTENFEPCLLWFRFVFLSPFVVAHVSQSRLVISFRSNKC